MKIKLAAFLIVLIAVPAFAIGDIAVGPFYGMTIPIVNDQVKSGSLFGVQGRVSLIPMLSIGAHFHSRTFGNPSYTFFEGTPNETTMETDGGKVSSLGVDAFLGKTGGGTGMNFYFMGSFGTYKWTRDNQEDQSKTAFAIGPGLEFVLPMKIGIEGRAMFEVASTGNDGTWKNVLWLVAVNYHIGLGPM